ncbi:hypothetical protein JCM10213v2_008147 [Rhodosporidiobolus nylandii]
MASSIQVPSPATSYTGSPSPHPAPPSSSSKAGLHADGPAFPSTFSPGSRAQHARRPSRAERYEALVAGAREVLKRGSVGLEGIGLGLEGEGEERFSNGEQLEPSHQLSTHDELAAQLKIAQSNLTLAETHSEFLEETLRRRDSRSSAQMGRHNSNGGGAVPPLPRQRAVTDDDASIAGGGALFGLGLSGGEDASPSTGAKGFFRLPSKRKPTPSTASIASTSTSSSMPPPNPPFAQTLRSVSSSPRLGDYSPNPTSPSFAHPRFSTSTTASSIDEHPNASPSYPSDIFALQTQVSSLETEVSALRSNNTSLRRNNDTLVGRCAELEKTKEDLMSELENLSVELFSEANTLVAEERRARAKAEEEVKQLRSDIDSLNQQLAILRQLIASRSAGSTATSTADPTSPDLPTLPASEPTTPPLGIASALQTFHESPSRIPPQAASIERPVSTVSVASTSSSSGRKWFSFGRSSSQSVADAPPVPSTSGAAESRSLASRSASHPVPSSDSLHPPAMQRGDSGSSYTSTASATSFFSFRSGTAPPEGISPDPNSRPSEDRPRPAGGKGKEKARELDLGIYIPGNGAVGMAKTDSEGGRTIGLRTPVAAEHALEQGRRQPLPLSPPPHGGVGVGVDAQEYLSSPPLPPLPPTTPQIPSTATAPSTIAVSPTSACRPSPPVAQPAVRPQRSAPSGPRPLAIHASLDPPLLSPARFSPLDPSSVPDVGGPREADMTASRKSPKSPNAMRWTEAAGSLVEKEQRRPRSRSTSRSRNEAAREREQVPPSPALPQEFKDAQALPPPPRPKAPQSARAASPLPPVPHAPPCAPSLRVDTSATALIAPGLGGGVKALVSASSTRPASPSTAKPLPSTASIPRRPSLSKAASSSDVPTTRASTAPHAPSPITASFPHSAGAVLPPRPGFLRADSASSVQTAGGRPRSPIGAAGGITPSTSASSLASGTSGSSHSSSGTALLRPRSAAGEHSRPLSPGGEKAVEDLEALMRNIMEMEEGLFSEAEEEVKRSKESETADVK